jgi:hypothetical protein
VDKPFATCENVPVQDADDADEGKTKRRDGKKRRRTEQNTLFRRTKLGRSLFLADSFAVCFCGVAERQRNTSPKRMIPNENRNEKE